MKVCVPSAVPSAAGEARRLRAFIKLGRFAGLLVARRGTVMIQGKRGKGRSFATQEPDLKSDVAMS